MIIGWIEILLGAAFSRIGMRTAAITITEHAYTNARSKLGQAQESLPLVVAFGALRNLVFLYATDHKSKAEQCIQQLIALLEDVATNSSRNFDIRMFLNPELTLVPIMCSFVLMPTEQAEDILERWCAINTSANGESEMSKEEFMSLLADDLDSSDLQSVRIELNNRVRKAYSGREVRIT